MKSRIAMLLGSILLGTPAVFGQQPPATVVPTALQTGAMAEQPKLTRFNLDFPGGTPAQLLRAIEKGLGKPINAIVPEESADLKLPALKLIKVNIAELFHSLAMASRRTESQRRTGAVFNSSYGFRTVGPESDDSVWYFYYDRPNPPQELNVCRFYNLGPYLETYKIDDITTAIQTGWKMLGETSTPAISFHKDTKLLIAVGDPEMLSLIDSVLKQLSVGVTASKLAAPSAAAKSGANLPKE